jgi:hypothetical protein
LPAILSWSEICNSKDATGGAELARGSLSCGLLAVLLDADVRLVTFGKVPSVEHSLRSDMKVKQVIVAAMTTAVPMAMRCLNIGQSLRVQNPAVVLVRDGK